MNLDLDHDFGFTTVEPADKLLDTRTDQIAELHSNIYAMYNKIMPLLVNLKKDPTKDIRWTNRVEVIDSFIGELNSLLPK